RRSANLAEGLVHAVLDRLGGLGGDLLRQGGKFLTLLRKRFELPAGMRARQLDEFRRRLGRDQFAEEIERRIGVRPRRLDHLEAVVGRALGGGRIGGLEHVGGLFGRGLHLLVGVLALGNTALRNSRKAAGISTFGISNFGISNFGISNALEAGLLVLGFEVASVTVSAMARPLILCLLLGCFTVCI